VKFRVKCIKDRIFKTFPIGNIRILTMEQIFQRRVLRSYIEHQCNELIEERWNQYKLFLVKVDQIKKWIETDYQTDFLNDIFEKCLGYVSKTHSFDGKYTLEREKKNEDNAQKADGAILVDGKVVAVIELKDQKTQNLEKRYSRAESAVKQAFGYLVSHKYARYVIVSNFNELRFYIDKETNYEKFKLFDLDYEGFKKLHTILSYESISNNLPLEIQKKSLTFEQDITNKLYKDYTAFRTSLFNNIKDNNPQINKSTLLHLTQKLIDRVVFILFAEDRGLLPTNTIPTIIKEYEDQRLTNFTLYEVYKIYFNAIDKGDLRLDIMRYNGGLFAKDDLLDSLHINDNILESQVRRLSAYDFESDISVNILGHIFEKSISDLEEITANINGIEFDKKKTAQKKNGAYYTPEYITKYIIGNTLGVLCEEKKGELGLSDITIEIPKNLSKLNLKEQKIEFALLQYRKYLLSLKILDPACGSGAFLNQAYNFLIKEHTFIDENEKILMGGNVLFAKTDISKNVLENNLYGVDIMSGAVEIAKLSLWLNTASPGSLLTQLSDKIKVGNSLIDDKLVVGNAFDWEQEFPEVFVNGGFDVVVGNPPYLRVQGLKDNFEKESIYYKKNYITATANYDIYVLFVERAFLLLGKTGKLGYILPHKFLVTDFGRGIREFLSKNRIIESLLHFGSEMVFKEASTYTCIIILSHDNDVFKYKSIKPRNIVNNILFEHIDYVSLGSKKWNLASKKITETLNKLRLQPFTIKDVFLRIFQGIATSADDVYLLEKTKNGLYSKSLNKIIDIEDGLLKPMLKGKNVSRYKKLENDYFIIFPYILEKCNVKTMTEAYIETHFPNGYIYLKENEILLRNREKGRFDNPKEWFLFSRKQGINGVEQPKIITPDIALKAQMTYDTGLFYHGTTIYSFIKNDKFKLDYKFYLSILNSSIMWFFIKNTSTELRGGYFRFKTKYLEPFPLPNLDNIQDEKPYVEKVDLILSLAARQQEKQQNFIIELEVEKITKKLQNFEELDFDDFIKEYKKVKQLKFKDKLEEHNFKNEWRSLFEVYKKDILELKTEIKITDKNLNDMVYKLYNLSSEDIEIIEESIKQI